MIRIFILALCLCGFASSAHASVLAHLPSLVLGPSGGGGAEGVPANLPKTRLSPTSTPTPLSQIAFPAKPSMPKASLRFTRAKAFVNKSQNSKPYT